MAILEQIDIPGATVVDPATDERHEAYAQKFAESVLVWASPLRKLALDERDATYFCNHDGQDGR